MLNGRWILQGVWQSIRRPCLSVAVPVLALAFLATAVQAREVSTRSDFPFIEALHELDSEEEKLEHLRSWDPSMGPENGLSDVDARRFDTLLDLSILHNVGRDGRLDREALMSDVLDLFGVGGKGVSNVTIDDEGNLRHQGSAIYIPSYVMFYFTLDSLIPGFFELL